MPNPNLHHLPRSDNTTAPLSPQPIQVRLTTETDEWVRSLPNRSAWLRRVITEAAQREQMGDDRS